MQTGGRSKTVKFPKHHEYGFGDVCFCVNIQPTSVSHMKVSMVLVPVGGNELEGLRDHNSRKFPVVPLMMSRPRFSLVRRRDRGLGLASSQSWSSLLQSLLK